VTAHAFEGEREKAIAAGMDDYVTKPLNANLLSEVIQRWWPKAFSRKPESGERLASLEVPAAEAVAEPQAPVLDPSVKRSAAVARVFLTHVPEQIASIGRAVAASEASTLKAAAHKLKGSCLAVGIPRMARLCAELEEGTRDPAQIFAELERVFGRAQGELAAQVPSDPTPSSAAG
jgi:HPt (histidine-containing phosphotransfer) domain-containing protein